MRRGLILLLLLSGCASQPVTDEDVASGRCYWVPDVARRCEHLRGNGMICYDHVTNKMVCHQ